MPRNCLVRGCKNTSKLDGFRAHRFPTDPKYRSIWTKQIQRTNPTWPGPSKYATVCSAHFESTCYDGALYSTFGIDIKPKLLPGAIPTIFPGFEKKPVEPSKELLKRERIRILDEVLGATRQQDAAGEETNKSEAVPVSLHVYEDEETVHPLQTIQPVNDVRTLQVEHNVEGEHLEDEIGHFASSSLPEETDFDPPSNIARLQDVMNFSEKSKWCLATDKQQHDEHDLIVCKPLSTSEPDRGSARQCLAVYNRQCGNSYSGIHGSPVNVAKEKDLSGRSRGGQCPARNQQQQGGTTEVICVVVKKVVHYVKAQEPPTNGDQLQALGERQQVSKVGQVGESPSLVRSSPGKGQSDSSGQDLEVKRSSGDGNDAEISEHDEFDDSEEEDDDYEMEDDSGDEDYVPEVRVRASARKKQRGKALRPRRTRQKASGDSDTTQPDEGDAGDEKGGTTETLEEDVDGDDNLPSSDMEDDMFSSSEDSDKIERREKQAGGKRQKKYKPTYVRLEVRFSRLPKMYECKTCQEKFKEADDMRTHYTKTHLIVPNKAPSTDQKEHTDESEPSLPPEGDIGEIATELRQCRNCKEYVKNMQKHYRTHMERKFKCETCGKGFISKYGLTQHKLVHESVEKRKIAKCRDCDKSFTTKGALSNHYETIHCTSSGQKRFVCDQCGKQFQRIRRLNVHKSIHLKDKPFKCSECGRGFSQKSNMSHHMRTHTGDRPYQCNVCQKAFNHNISLKTHQKKAHGIDWWKDKNI